MNDSQTAFAEMAALLANTFPKAMELPDTEEAERVRDALFDLIAYSQERCGQSARGRVAAILGLEQMDSE